MGVINAGKAIARKASNKLKNYFKSSGGSPKPPSGTTSSPPAGGSTSPSGASTKTNRTFRRFSGKGRSTGINAFQGRLNKAMGLGDENVSWNRADDYMRDRLTSERNQLRQQFKEGKLKDDERFGSLRDIDDYILGQGKEGPEFMDYMHGYGVPKKAATATVGLAGVSVINNMFDGGHKSNAELYSNPF